MDVLAGGGEALQKANSEMGLGVIAWTKSIISRTISCVSAAIPTDVELMMFAQANSEHCRHKIFQCGLGDRWRATGKVAVLDDPQHAPAKPAGHGSCVRRQFLHYRGSEDRRFYPGQGNAYGYAEEQTHILMKVETHNHPTAISPLSGCRHGCRRRDTRRRRHRPGRETEGGPQRFFRFQSEHAGVYSAMGTLPRSARGGTGNLRQTRAVSHRPCK